MRPMILIVALLVFLPSAAFAQCGSTSCGLSGRPVARVAVAPFRTLRRTQQLRRSARISARQGRILARRSFAGGC